MTALCAETMFIIQYLLLVLSVCTEWSLRTKQLPEWCWALEINWHYLC